MKYYLVILKNNREVVVKAKGYHRDNQQYVFEAEDPKEVQFFLVSQVVGVSVLRDDATNQGGTLVQVPL